MHTNIRFPVLFIFQLLIGALALPLQGQPDTLSAAAAAKDPAKAAAESMAKPDSSAASGDTAEAVKNDSVQKNVFVAPPEKPAHRFHLKMPKLTPARIVLSSLAVCGIGIGAYFNSQVNKRYSAYVAKFNGSPDNVNDANWKKVENMESYRDFSYVVAGLCVVGLVVSLTF